MTSCESRKSRERDSRKFDFEKRGNGYVYSVGWM